MSDTDDTDALLTCDPGGGLEHLLGRTMEGFSTSQLDSTNSSSDKTNDTNESNTLSTPNTSDPKVILDPSPSSGSKKTIKKKNAKRRKAAAAKAQAMDKDSTLDVSDFFNSENELVLPNVSQLSETSLELDKEGNDGRGSSNSENGSSSSLEKSSSSSGDLTTTGTVKNNTFLPVKTKPDQSTSSSSGTKSRETKNLKVNETDSCCKITNTETKNERTSSSFTSGSDLSSTSSSALVQVNPSSVPLDIQDNLKRQILEANKNNPEVEKMLESNSTNIAYGVLNLNLNDLKTFAEGLSRTSIFPSPKEEKVSTFVPTRSSKGEQVFTRAPNFRTPGGYKPPQNPRKCRDLTEEEIREEVRKMYAFPFVEDEDDESEKGEKKSSNEGKEEIENGNSDKGLMESGEKPKVQFNFLDGTQVPNEFGKGKSGKPIKRKLLPHGGGVCGSNIGSIPDLGFGVRAEMSSAEPVEVNEPIIDKQTSYTTGSNLDPNAKVSESMNVKQTNVSAAPRFSFGYGEEENLLSPIRPAILQSSGSHDSSNISQLNHRFQPSPEKNSLQTKAVVCNPVPDNATVANISDTRSTSGPDQKQIQQRKIPDVQPMAQSLLGVSRLPSQKRRPIRKAATKYRAMTSPRSSYFDEGEIGSRSENPSCGLPPAPVGSVASDLEKILSEIDLPAEEIESLIENFDEDESDFTDVGLFDDAEMDGNLVGALSELKLDLDVWKNKGKGEMGSEAYFTEKFKREQCEKELRQLQENFMAQKQQNAVLEGTLKRRNMMLVQITMAFNRVCKEWKKFDAENKATVGKLQQDQKVLAAACKHSKERIAQYEKELHKTLELADSFKIKVFDVQKERDQSVMVLKEANTEMEQQIRELKEEMGTLKNERDATLRALRESQVKLDESRNSLENLELQLQQLQERDSESSRKYDELLQVKAQQDSNYMDVMERRNELEALVMNLTAELNLEKSNKDQLRRELQEEAARKTRAEAERLHEYYNKKVQDILKSATEEAARAESGLRDQIKRAALESESKLAECKEKYQREIETLKAKYDAELEKLKRENLHRQLLISSTVKQLQLGESSNLEINAVSVQQTRSQRKDLFGSLKPQNCQEKGETNYKTINPTSLTKFTLDHLPGLVSSNQHQRSKEMIHGRGSQEEIMFGNSGNFVRYKTSTPIEAQGHLNSAGESKGGGDYRKVRPIGNNDMSFNSFLEKVCGEKSGKSTGSVHSSSESTDFKNALSHLLEAPVKPEKELQNPIKFQENPLDPHLQKCIQDLLRSYADKFQNHDSGSGRNNVMVGSVTSSSHLSAIPNSNNVPLNINKNDVESSNNKSNGDGIGDDDERCHSHSLSTSSSAGQGQASQQDCRSESRKAKADLNKGPQQSTSQSKPPWK